MSVTLPISTDIPRQKIVIITTDDSILDQLQNDGNKLSIIERIFSSSSTNGGQNPNQRDTTQVTQKKTKAKDSGPLTCVICGSLAHGYNFGAIACEGCKAFFRRNAHKDPMSFRCNSNGQCQITLQTRRECSACRLSKCLTCGMQPDRLSTVEQKVAKRQKIEENRNLIVTSTPDSTPSDPSPAETIVTPSIDASIDFTDFTDILSPLLAPKSMSFEELQRVETISLLYQKRIELATQEGLPWDPSVQSQTFLQTLNSHSVPLMRLLSFFKQIPEFNQLNVDDKVTLIKYNLIELLVINCALFYDPKTDRVIESSSDAPWNTEFFRVLHGYSFGLRIKKIFESFLSVAQYDQKIIHLTLVTLILTKGFSASGLSDEPVLNDNMAVYRAQNYYAELLWKYLETIHGYEKAIQLFSKLIGDVIAWQNIQETIRTGIMRTLSPEDMNQLVPIMRSVLNIP